MAERQQTAELDGKGRLSTAGGRTFDVDYHLEFWIEKNGRPTTSGTVTADPADLNAAYDEGSCQLEVENGSVALATLARPEGNKAELKDLILPLRP